MWTNMRFFAYFGYTVLFLCYFQNTKLDVFFWYLRVRLLRWTFIDPPRGKFSFLLCSYILNTHMHWNTQCTSIMRCQSQEDYNLWLYCRLFPCFWFTILCRYFHMFDIYSVHFLHIFDIINYVFFLQVGNKKSHTLSVIILLVYLKSAESQAPSFIMTEAQSFHTTVSSTMQHRELRCPSNQWHKGASHYQWDKTREMHIHHRKSGPSHYQEGNWKSIRTILLHWSNIGHLRVKKESVWSNKCCCWKWLYTKHCQDS